MYSNIRQRFTLLTLILYSSFIPVVLAESSTALSAQVAFSVQPQQCVTLHQGRDCFATVVIQWEKPTEQALCLYQVNTKKADAQKQLMCWAKSKKGQASISFESSDNLTYQLRTLKDKTLIAEAEMVVSWVHKNTTKRRRWRLF